MSEIDIIKALITIEEQFDDKCKLYSDTNEISYDRITVGECLAAIEIQ